MTTNNNDIGIYITFWTISLFIFMVRLTIKFDRKYFFFIYKMPPVNCHVCYKFMSILMLSFTKKLKGVIMNLRLWIGCVIKLFTAVLRKPRNQQYTYLVSWYYNHYVIVWSRIGVRRKCFYPTKVLKIKRTRWQKLYIICQITSLC